MGNLPAHIPCWDQKNLHGLTARINLSKVLKSTILVKNNGKPRMVAPLSGRAPVAGLEIVGGSEWFNLPPMSCQQ